MHCQSSPCLCEGNRTLVIPVRHGDSTIQAEAEWKLTTLKPKADWGQTWRYSLTNHPAAPPTALPLASLLHPPTSNIYNFRSQSAADWLCLCAHFSDSFDFCACGDNCSNSSPNHFSSAEVIVCILNGFRLEQNSQGLKCVYPDTVGNGRLPVCLQKALLKVRLLAA